MYMTDVMMTYIHKHIPSSAAGTGVLHAVERTILAVRSNKRRWEPTEGVRLLRNCKQIASPTNASLDPQTWFRWHCQQVPIRRSYQADLA